MTTIEEEAGDRTGAKVDTGGIIAEAVIIKVVVVEVDAAVLIATAFPLPMLFAVQMLFMQSNPSAQSFTVLHVAPGQNI